MPPGVAPSSSPRPFPRRPAPRRSGPAAAPRRQACSSRRCRRLTCPQVGSCAALPLLFGLVGVQLCARFGCSPPTRCAPLPHQWTCWWTSTAAWHSSRSGQGPRSASSTSARATAGEMPSACMLQACVGALLSLAGWRKVGWIPCPTQRLVCAPPLPTPPHPPQVWQELPVQPPARFCSAPQPAGPAGAAQRADVHVLRAHRAVQVWAGVPLQPPCILTFPNMNMICDQAGSEGNGDGQERRPLRLSGLPQEAGGRGACTLRPRWPGRSVAIGSCKPRRKASQGSQCCKDTSFHFGSLGAPRPSSAPGPASSSAQCRRCRRLAR